MARGPECGVGGIESGQDSPVAPCRVIFVSQKLSATLIGTIVCLSARADRSAKKHNEGAIVVDRLQFLGTVILMIVAAMSGWVFGMWPVLLVLGLSLVARAVERRMGGKRLADLRIPAWVAVLLVLVPIALAVLIIASPLGGQGNRQLDHPGGATPPASLRAINAIRIGAPFGGFRIAFRPGFIDWSEGFVALEQATTRATAFLVGLPPDQRARMLRGEVPWPDEFTAQMAPQLGSRRGVIDGVMNGGGTDLVLRGSFAFAWWPLGEWVVYQGVHIRPDNRAEPFSDDELRPLW